MNMIRHKLTENYLLNLCYQALIIVLPLITVPYVSRVFGADGVGIQSYTNSIITYFILFGSLGAASYGQREIAMCHDDREKAGKVFWEIFYLRLITISIALAVYLTSVAVFSKSYTGYYLALLPMIFAAMLDVVWLFQGLEEFRTVVIRNVAVRLLGTALIFLFIRNKSDLILYILLLTLTEFCGNALLLLGIRRNVGKIRLHGIRPFRHFRNVVIYFIPSFAISIYSVLDKTMLGMMVGSELENGYYEQTYKIINLANTIIFSLNTVMAPRMASLFGRGEESEMHRHLKVSLRFFLLLSIPAAFGIISIARCFVPLFFGPGYEKVTLLLCLLAPIVPFISISSCISAQHMGPRGEQVRISVILGIGAVLNFLINLLLIPRLASTGAVIASVLAEILITVLFVTMSKKSITWSFLVRSAWRYLISGAVMGVVVILLGTWMKVGIFCTLLQLVCGVILYTGVIWLLKDEILSMCLDKLRKQLRFGGAAGNNGDE